VELNDLLTTNTGKTEAILSARAAALAEEPRTETEQDGLDILEFRLGDETYGIESSYVREVYPLKDYTPLPSTPAFVLGITSVRGEVFSIVDLGSYFGLPIRNDAEPELVVIVQSGEMHLALLVDSVEGVHIVPLAEIQQAPPVLTGGCAPYLRGLTPERTSLLDIAALLADPKLVVGRETED
jgi:purine-binding chemotaxis protein CheW